MRSLALVRMPVLVLLFAAGLAVQMPAARPAAPGVGQGAAVVLAAEDDPYLPLAAEVAAHDGAALAHTMAGALAHNPAVLLWVASPAHLSERALVDAGRALKGHGSGVAVGIISGATMEEARALWRRAGDVRGQRVLAVNAEYPAADVMVGRIAAPGEAPQVLSMASLQEALQASDYLTFTGHGGRGYWRLDEGTTLRSERIPPLGPLVVTAASCKTFRPWEPGSIALAFIGRGAAAYAGFVCSPNEGYLMGEFDGLPFRYTWPDFPIGYAIAAQNRGALQGFAALPCYWLLGDPRIALQTAPPYQLLRDEVQGDRRVLAYTGLPAGVVPIRVPRGAGYSYVQAVGVTAAWAHAPFYNSRLQMVDIGADTYLLVEHAGGDLTLALCRRPPLSWLPLDALADSLDHTLIHIQRGGGDLIALAIGGLALLAVAWRLLRRTMRPATLVPAALAGLAFAALRALYTLARLGRVTITSKPVAAFPLAWAATFLLVTAGAALYLAAGSRRGRELALWLAALPPALAMAVGLCSVAFGVVILAPPMLPGLYNASLALLAMGTLIVELGLFELTFALLRRLAPGMPLRAAGTGAC